MSKPATKARIFLVDDHPIVRQGLTALIDDRSDLEVVGYADNADSAFQEAITGRFDLMVVDLSLKNSDGLELIEKLQQSAPSIKILVLSMHGDPKVIERVMRLGARGFVHKEEAHDCVVKAVYRVLAGEIFLNEKDFSKVVLHREPIDEKRLLQKLLSKREVEILAEIGSGRTNGEIASALGITSRTVEAHKENLKKKLNLRSNQDLTIFCATRKIRTQQT